MATRIALFNHKGGVSKTTTTFNIGWMLAEKGKKVIIVDTDPQCNLTGMVLGYKGPSELERFFEREPERNILAGLKPAFEAQPKTLEPVDCVSVDGAEGLWLLPGHIKLAEYETTLGIAQQLTDSLQTLQNLPGSITHLMDITAKKYDADYILIDMSPSLSAINRNLLMTCNFFILPTSPDYFSVMAIDSMCSVIPNWSDWAKKARGNELLEKATYPFPSTVPKFLGTIVQKYRPRGGEPARAFQEWINRIEDSVSQKLWPILEKEKMTLSAEAYSLANIDENYCLTTIPDFNSLIARSQDVQKPVFALEDEELMSQGIVKEKMQESRGKFREIFSDLAQKIILLTER